MPVPKPMSSSILTLQFNEIAPLQIPAGSTADTTVYIRPLSVRVGTAGFSLFTSTYFTTVAVPAFGYYDVAEQVSLEVKFRPSMPRQTNLYLPVQSASTRDSILPASTSELTAFSDFASHNPESSFAIKTYPSKDSGWLGCPTKLLSALLTSVGTSDYAIPRTLMFHIQYPVNLTTALAYDYVMGELQITSVV